MSTAEKIADLRASLDGQSGPVAEAIRSEIARLEKAASASATRIFKDHYCGDLVAGTVLYCYERNAYTLEKNPTGTFRVRTVLAVSPKGDKIATKQNYNGRPAYVTGTPVYAEGEHGRSVKVGITVPYGAWRTTRQAAFLAWAGNATENAEYLVKEAQAKLVKCTQERGALHAFLESDFDLEAVPGVNR